MSRTSELRAWAVASAAVFCLSAIGYRVLTFHMPILPDLTPTVTAANAALATVNRPCAPGPCGTLANINKLIVKSGDIAVDVHRQVQQSGTLINAASLSLTSTSDTVNAQLGHIGPLLDSARGATDAVPITLAGFTPLFVNANGAVSDVRALVTSPAIPTTLSNVQSVSASAAAISEDARKVSNKVTADYLRPVPWYMWPVRRSGQLLDVGAAVARHTP